MMTTTVSTADLKRRMHGAVEALKHDLAGLRTGRASTALLDCSGALSPAVAGRTWLDVGEALVGEYRKSGDWPAKIKLHI